MSSQELALANRLDTIARRVTRKVCRSSWGFHDKDNPKCIEAFSIAHFETYRVWNGHPEYSNKRIAFYVRKRLKSALAHKSLAFNKPVAEHKGVPLEERTYTKQHALEAPAIEHQFPLDLAYENDVQRDVVEWLTSAQLSQQQIANKVGITAHRIKETIRSLKKAKTQVNRRERTSDPRRLNALPVCDHGGDPVVRMKDQICETVLDELLVDLYRSGVPVETIAEQVGQPESRVTHRLGVLAHRHICM